MAAKIHPLLELRDAAYEAAAPAHERMKNEISLYRNEDYTGESWIKRFKRSVTRSISPQINTAINRLIPVFTEQMAHVNVEPIRKDASELERLATDELQEHLDNLEAVDSETEELRTLILHNQAMGNAISKTVYDPTTEMVRAVAINPLRFAPSPYATRSDFRGGGYVVHTTYHNYMTVSKKYADAPIPNKPYNDRALMGGNIARGRGLHDRRDCTSDRDSAVERFNGGDRDHCGRRTVSSEPRRFLVSRLPVRTLAQLPRCQQLRQAERFLGLRLRHAPGTAAEGVRRISCQLHVDYTKSRHRAAVGAGGRTGSRTALQLQRRYY